MNLIICITPLQVLIAKKIIEQTGGAFTGLYLPYGDGDKHRYYFQKLQAVCQQAVFVELKNHGLAQQLATLQQLKTTLRQLTLWQQPIDTVYLASIDVLFLQYVISKVRFKHLMTFDDGTANIFPDSSYFHPLPKSLSHRLFKRAVGIRYPSVASILAVTQKHYTIFANEKNLIDHVEVLKLFADHPQQPNTPSAAQDRTAQGMTAQATPEPKKSATKVTRLLMGQGLDSFIGEAAYLALINAMIARFGITDFMPHPREKLALSDRLQVIHSDKIVEDYILDALATQPEMHFEIYTFFSTAVFALRDFPRTQVILVKNAALQQRFAAAYQFLASRGFEVIDLEPTPTAKVEN